LTTETNVVLEVYSINGQKVVTLVDNRLPIGNHSVVLDGSKYASGIYMYRMISQGVSLSGKMLLIK
jgi:membrane-bound inhibitor of C-type lysozyme